MLLKARKLDEESRAARLDVFHSVSPAILKHEIANDREADSGSAAVRRRRRSSPHEWLPHSLALVHRDACALILDHDPCPSAERPRLDTNGLPNRAILDGVFEEVENDLPQ